ncbi:MAG: ATP synthase F1 subunit delta [Deltaproteobacteria bacterium]|nr:ATP synthase F1 subunit delta [Deltaproteobacteria bacterium]
MIGQVLARRYARAIMDLATEKGLVGEIGEDLKNIASLFTTSPDLENVFSDPTVPHAAKEKVLNSIFEKINVRELAGRFVSVLLEKNRIDGIGEIAEAYQHLYDLEENRIRARVVVAAPLGDRDTKRVHDALSKLSGKEIVLQVEVDESIVGGMVAYVGGRVYDGSISNQLQQIKDTLSTGR